MVQSTYMHNRRSTTKKHTQKRSSATKRPLLIVGNWKMNPSTVGAARKLFLDIRKELGKKKLRTDVAIAPPFPFLSELERLSPSQRIKLAAQDVFFESGGSFTGEVSIAMLKSVGVSSIITGHSETRALGATDEEVGKDVLAILKSTLSPIVCIGESRRDTQGHYFTVVETQLRTILSGVPRSKLAHVVIAYEPVWAISTGDGRGKTATPEDVHEMRLFIQKVLSDLFGRTAAAKVRVLYGGSVNEKNAQSLLEAGLVDGFLIGGVSLRPREFSNVIEIAENYGKH